MDAAFSWFFSFMTGFFSGDGNFTIVSGVGLLDLLLVLFLIGILVRNFLHTAR